jgi:predicted TIM-barrel fold metal-dependent hydrolase
MATMQKFGGGGPKKTIRDIWNENVWVTTTGMYTVEAFAMLMHTTKVNRIMFGADYPYDDIRYGQDFLVALRGSGLLTQEELEDFSWRNAETLLGITA